MPVVEIANELRDVVNYFPIDERDVI